MNDFLTAEFWKDTAVSVASWAVATLPSILMALLVGFVALRVVHMVLRRAKAMMLQRLIKKPADTGEQEKRVETLMNLLASTVRIIIWTMIGLLVLRNLGIDIGPLLAGAGIAGLAVGFGAQELVRDVISGFFILLENQVREGDAVIINGTAGMVEEVGLRTMVLRDVAGVVHVFQNGKIDTLSNMSKEWSAMVFDIGVAYKEDTDHVSRVMKSVADDLHGDPAFAPNILEPIEIMGVNDFGDSAVVVRARIKTKPRQQWAVGREYRRRLKKAFDSLGIEIPFPHTTVYWGAQIDPLQVGLDGAQDTPVEPDVPDA